MVLEVQDLKKSYRDGSRSLPVLKGLNLVLAAGQSLAVMGPSGCGKSTLISCLAGLTLPDDGTIRINDQTFSNLRGNELAKFRARNIGVVFQQFHLLPHLTACENVRLPLDLAGVSGPDAQTRAMTALEGLGLSTRQDHFPNQLSRGECQRVAIARVMVMKPRLILADEPTASLDRPTAVEVMRQLVTRSKEQNAALIVVTHDKEMAAFCDSRVSFRDGALEAAP